MNPHAINRFFVWADRFSDTTLTLACCGAVIGGWALITLLAAVVLL